MRIDCVIVQYDCQIRNWIVIFFKCTAWIHYFKNHSILLGSTYQSTCAKTTDKWYKSNCKNQIFDIFAQMQNTEIVYNIWIYHVLTICVDKCIAKVQFFEIQDLTLIFSIFYVLHILKPFSQFPGLFKRKFSIVRVGIFWKILHH